VAAEGVHVSPSGSDTDGDGSSAHPYRTLHAALAHAGADASEPSLTLVLADGTYDEALTLTRSVVVQGGGSDRVTIRNPAPMDGSFVITADGDHDPAHPIRVELRGLRVDGWKGTHPGIEAKHATLVLSNVEVYQPSGTGVRIGEDIADFAITDTRVGFEGELNSDLGIDVGSHSSGTITRFHGGDHIDHIIDIGLGCHVTIRDSELTGSPIYYADGVRIQGASDVTVENTQIVRPPGGQAASSGPAHNPPYAGIEIAASSDEQARVHVNGCTVRGFDVGVGINLTYNAVNVEHSTLAGNVSADVRTLWAGALVEQYPSVDLGGGALGSAGDNDFGNGSELAIDHGAPYDVSALNDRWGVTGSAIDARIHDASDDAQLGHVLY
jgi:hypothetical protein